MLKRLAYSSVARMDLTQDDLKDIIQTCRDHNETADITGVLVYTGNAFIQVLEGAEDSLTGLLGKIIKDARHEEVEVLLNVDITQRSFNKWSMGFLYGYDLDKPQFAGGSSYEDIVETLSGSLQEQDSFIKSCLKALQRRH
ncbi:BLUF domain-containing protein [Terasakiella pusilla]|uniref:BLUF domain-containing protein n=1 Tax=Terasakiella pusilla TaxID=64973 RepID=UPI00068D4AC7|nr:BLUF domain-containing protein [Terasakiella pusilla]